MKRTLSLLVTLCLLLSLFSGGVITTAQSDGEPLEPSVSQTPPPVNFDEDNVVLSFGAISDIHIETSATHNYTKRYAKALQVLKKHAGGNLDAVAVSGDFAYNEYNKNIGTAFKTVTDAELGEDAKVFFVAGNHDAYTTKWSMLRQLFSDLSKYTADDLPSSNHDRGNRHAVINGYHYIGINMMDYWNTEEAKYAQQDLDWLATELAAARADAPGQPIFVNMHVPIYNTTYGSDLYTTYHWYSKSIYDYLKNYPEVVTFSGHVHYPINDDRTIYQRDFTSLNCGSVQFMTVYLESNGETVQDYVTTISTGLLVQVDKNNNLKITRLDFGKDQVIKQPFYISAPDLENKTNLLHYNDDHFNVGNTAPVFDSEAELLVNRYDTRVSVTVPAATDNDMVHHYVVEVEGATSGTKLTQTKFSRFYYFPTLDKFPKEYDFSFSYSSDVPNEEVIVRAYAVDSMGLRSEPLVDDPTNVPLGEIVTQPTDVSVYEGEMAQVSFTTEGKNLTYRWYHKDKGETEFHRATGYPDTAYEVEMTPEVDGRRVYCEVVNRVGQVVCTDTVTLTMKVDPPTIITQPRTVTYAKEGAFAKVAVQAQGKGITYQWYIKNDGKTKYSKSSVTTPIYTVKMSAAAHNRRLYCVVTDKYGNTVQSNTVLVRRQATVTKEPATVVEAKYKAKATVKVSAVGDGLKYQWYVKNRGASKYSKSSVTKSTYSVTMTDKVKGRRVYCVVTDRFGNKVQTKSTLLQMNATVTSQPKSVTAKKNATAKVTVKAKGDGLKYTWYVKNSGASKYSKSSVTKSAYSVKMTAKVKNRLVYCIVTDKYGNQVATVAARLKMK